MENLKGFLRLMQSAYFFAEKANNCCFNSPEEHQKDDKCCALSYAAACTAKCSAAEAIYWMSPEMYDPELPELFAQFDILVREIQSDYETDHSRQWVDERFRKLKTLYENSMCSQPIPD